MKKQNFEFQHTVLSKTQELTEWAVISCHKSVWLFEKLGSLKERTEKLQMCRRKQKSQKYQTWLLVHHAQSNSLYTNYCYLRGLDLKVNLLCGLNNTNHILDTYIYKYLIGILEYSQFLGRLKELRFKKSLSTSNFLVLSIKTVVLHGWDWRKCSAKPNNLVTKQ